MPGYTHSETASPCGVTVSVSTVSVASSGFCGAVRLLRVYRLSRDPEKAADYDAMLKDERTVYVANKARSMTFFICVYAQLAAGLLALLVFKQPIIGQVLCLVTCAQSLIFCGTYWYYNKKY